MNTKHTPAVIKDGYFTQGEVRFLIDSNNLAKALDQADKLNAVQKKQLAEMNDIPCEPFDRHLLRKPLLGVVQNAWHKAKAGVIPADVVAGQERRLALYRQQLEDLINHSPDDIVGYGRRKPKAVSVQILSKYSMDDNKKADWSKFKGQKYLIIKTMSELELKSKTLGVTCAEIAAAVQETPETLAPSRTNVQFYLNQWKKAGLLTVVNAEEIATRDAKRKQNKGETVAA